MRPKLEPSTAFHQDRPECTVGIVITTFNQAGFLREALHSCMVQRVPADSIIVIDDGSNDHPELIVQEFPAVKLIRQDNAGLPAARNAGLRACRTDLIIFLDADDRLLPEATSAGAETLSRDIEAWMAYGGHRLIDESGRVTSPCWSRSFGTDAFEGLLSSGNVIAMHATVMYRRDRLCEIGGFDESLPCCEDYDLYLRIASNGVIVRHDIPVAEYRQHKENMSRNAGRMLDTAIMVIERHAAKFSSDKIAVAALSGKRTMQRHYLPDTVFQAGMTMFKSGPRQPGIMRLVRLLSLAPFMITRSLAGRALRKAASILPRWAGRLFGERLWKPPVGRVEFGDFGRTRPIGAVFGFDRGLPVDRYYIDQFLGDNAQRIKGRTLEVGDDEYVRKFGGPAVTASEILHVDASNERAHYYGDLSVPGILPNNTFDAIVLTQTLHLVFKMDQALNQLHAALKPGGCLLVTAPGISPIEPWQWRDSWYWSLTTNSLQRLLTEAFPGGQVAVRNYGNFYAAVSFLAGLASEELDQDKLNKRDRDFPVLVGGMAIKAKDR